MTESDELARGIAVVGLALRFPGASDPRTFWRNLCDGVESIRRFSDEELRQAGVAEETLRDRRFVPAAGALDGFDEFDADFFGISPREAETIDPQHRLFLECGWEALEDAGYDPARVPGPVGVYAGAGRNSYLLSALAARRSPADPADDFALLLGNERDFLPTRVSYKLGLRGPSLNVNTACSSSLVAVHLACQALLGYECDLALAGGVAVKVPHEAGYVYQDGAILSPDGHCRAFDAAARGTVPGSGSGIVVLKRLDDALADGDSIRAVILASAINNDGNQKVGYTAPAVEGQAAVIAEALELARVSAETVGYVESHGTATPLGDPVEVEALTQAFRSSTAARGFCALGSVKTNLGHLDAAAGVAGLIKAVLAVEHGVLPPSLHFEHANPAIDFDSSPFYVNATAQPWGPTPGPRRAGVSSFGIGGTNAHLILEQAPAALPVPAPAATPSLLTLSARSPAALEATAARLADELERRPELRPTDVAYTLQLGRRAFAYRRAVVYEDRADALAALRTPAPAGKAAADEPRVAFLFPGQGAQHVRMGESLYRGQPAFRRHLDRCADVLEPHLGVDLRSVLYPEGGADEAALRQTDLAQPALFAIEYALARLWMSWGIEPAAFIGHSVGEYVAACLAGVFTLEDALALIAARGRLMHAQPPGAMLAVALAESDVGALLGSAVSVAAVNAPEQVVLAGPENAIAAIERRVEQQGVRTRRLHTSHAFHSPLMDDVRDDFEALVRRVSLQPPHGRWVSNLTGDWVTAQQATDPSHWARQLREPVRFAAGLARLAEAANVLLEVGPGQTLSTLARQQGPQASSYLTVASLPRPGDRHCASATVLSALGRLWEAGCPVRWTATHPAPGRRVALPTYPFERRRYLLQPTAAAPAVEGAAPDPYRRSDPAQWLYVPAWQRVALPAAAERLAATQQRWLVLADACGVGDALAARVREQGGHAVVVRPGAGFARRGESEYEIGPRRSQDYDLLLRDTGPPDVVAHLWALTAADAAEPEFEHVQDLGFRSVMFLAQALSRHGSHAPVQLTLVSSHVHDVLGDEPLQPAKATLLGPCKVVPQEHPHVRCRQVDMTAPRSSPDVPALAGQLHHELTSTAATPVVAYRGAQRWTQCFAPMTGSGAACDLREGGVYLITGGLGRIGLTLAAWLARTRRAKLALVGRSALPVRSEWARWVATHPEDDAVRTQIEQLQAVEATGGRVLVLHADVSDPGAMRSAIEAAERELGSLHGVIHAAGRTDVASLGLVETSGPEDWDRHFRPKVDGLRVLDAALAGRTPDFVALFSSLSSVLGGVGFAAYSAANAFLDAHACARARVQGSTRWLSIGWDGWQFDPGTRPGRGVAALALSPQDGIEAFSTLMGSAAAGQVLVSTADVQARQRRWVEQSRPAGAAERRERSGPVRARAEAAPTAAAPRDEYERAVAECWQELLGVDDIAPDDDLVALGADSLLALRSLSRLSSRYGVELPLQELFGTPTVTGIADALRRACDGGHGSLPAPAEKPRSATLPSDLVRLREGDGERPLFLVHPAGGTVFCYRDLVDGLGAAGTAVYGLESCGVSGDEPPLRSIEAMAERYVDAVLGVQPTGPYLLAGASMGGTVVFEMAQQLQRSGREVALLALLDTPGPGQMPLPMDDDRAILSYLAGDAADLSDLDAPQVRRLLEVFKANSEAMWQYEPAEYSGRIAFFRARERGTVHPLTPELPWTERALGGIEVHIVPGDHKTMLEAPHAATTAHLLGQHLRSIDGISRSRRQAVIA